MSSLLRMIMNAQPRSDDKPFNTIKDEKEELKSMFPALAMPNTTNTLAALEGLMGKWQQVSLNSDLYPKQLMLFRIIKMNPKRIRNIEVVLPLLKEGVLEIMTIHLIEKGPEGMMTTMDIAEIVTADIEVDQEIVIGDVAVVQKIEAREDVVQSHHEMRSFFLSIQNREKFTMQKFKV